MIANAKGIAVRIKLANFVFTITLISINKKTQIDTTTDIVVMPFAFIIIVNPAAERSLMIMSYSILLLFLRDNQSSCEEYASEQYLYKQIFIECLT